MFLRYIVYNVLSTLVLGQKMKKLDLAVSWKGGIPAIFATNVIRNGDYATIAFIYGSSQGELVDNGKYLIELSSEFNKPEILNQVKAFLTGINNTISFANDELHGCFVNPEEVVKKAKESYSLMSFEENLILKDKQQLHLIYVSAIKNNKQATLPKEFEYQLYSGGLYPIRQVYSAICALI